MDSRDRHTRRTHRLRSKLSWLIFLLIVIALAVASFYVL